jgi:hypothetical protein
VRAAGARGKRVIVAGLDQDYAGRPFEPMPQLLAIAEYITKTLAICVVCGAPANRTYRKRSAAAACWWRRRSVRGTLPSLLTSWARASKRRSPHHPREALMRPRRIVPPHSSPSSCWPPRCARKAEQAAPPAAGKA